MKRIYTDIYNNCYLEKKSIKFSKMVQAIEWNIIRIYPNIVYQTWNGFGGSFTEAA